MSKWFAVQKKQPRVGSARVYFGESNANVTLSVRSLSITGTKSEGSNEKGLGWLYHHHLFTNAAADRPGGWTAQ